MVLLISRRQFTRWSLASLVGYCASGCGTIMYPERKGQPAGNLDWKVVTLDGVGLLLFLVPGVIAFAVDFNNGSIYLPSEEKAQAKSQRHQQRKLISLTTKSGKLTRGAVEDAVTQYSGHQIRLVDGLFQTHQLENIEQFWDKRDHLQERISSSV
jgi:hypothetical protein